VVVAAAKDNNK